MSNAGELYRWVESLQERGRYTFTRAEAAEVSDVSSSAAQRTLLRLKKNRSIVSPRRDFFVVVPREYRSAGSPPASWFIDNLMRHLRRSYYVSLLSAAALHGAAHQQPMALQVIADAPERDIIVGRVRIEFHTSNSVAEAVTTRIQTETGTMVVATPATTAFDLVRFPAASGYWNNIATVLLELTEDLDPQTLASGATRIARTDLQRLGWLLNHIHREEHAESLAQYLKGKRIQPVPLAPEKHVTSAELDDRWKVLVNDCVEVDV